MTQRHLAFLSTDIKDFLEMCTKELGETFSSTCTFPRMSKVLMQHIYEMKVKVEKMRRYGWLLSPGKAATLLGKGRVKATTVNIKDLNLLCLLYWPSALIFQTLKQEQLHFKFQQHNFITTSSLSQTS